MRLCESTAATALTRLSYADGASLRGWIAPA